MTRFCYKVQYWYNSDVEKSGVWSFSVHVHVRFLCILDIQYPTICRKMLHDAKDIDYRKCHALRNSSQRENISAHERVTPPCKSPWSFDCIASCCLLCLGQSSRSHLTFVWRLCTLPSLHLSSTSDYSPPSPYSSHASKIVWVTWWLKIEDGSFWVSWNMIGKCKRLWFPVSFQRWSIHSPLLGSSRYTCRQWPVMYFHLDVPNLLKGATRLTWKRM